MYFLTVTKYVPLQWDVVDRRVDAFMDITKERVFKKGLEHLGCDLKNSLDFIDQPDYETMFKKKINIINLHKSDGYIEYCLSKK
jgi:hypothetical protein